METNLSKTKLSAPNWFIALSLIAVGLAVGAAGIYVGDTDDAPGAALIGIVVLIGMVVLGVKTARRRM